VIFPEPATKGGKMAICGSKSALLIVDVQNDFCPGGALPVAEGDSIIPVLNRYCALFVEKGLPVFMSRDWHPEITSHFKVFGGIWSAHCVMGSKGAEFHPGMKLPDKAVIISKGMNPSKDDYSAFDGFDKYGKSFSEILRNLAVTKLFVGGLATDYCVKESVLAALQHGISVTLLEDAIRGVDIKPGNSATAIAEMKAAGAESDILSTIVLS